MPKRETITKEKVADAILALYKDTQDPKVDDIIDFLKKEHRLKNTWIDIAKHIVGAHRDPRTISKYTGACCQNFRRHSDDIKNLLTAGLTTVSVKDAQELSSEYMASSSTDQSEVNVTSHEDVLKQFQEELNTSLRTLEKCEKIHREALEKKKLKEQLQVNVQLQSAAEEIIKMLADKKKELKIFLCKYGSKDSDGNITKLHQKFKKEEVYTKIEILDKDTAHIESIAQKLNVQIENIHNKYNNMLKTLVEEKQNTSVKNGMNSRAYSHPKT